MATLQGNLSITKGLNHDLMPGLWRDAGIRLQVDFDTMPAARPKDKFRVQYTISGGQVEGRLNGVWTNIGLTGYWGSAAGFEIDPERWDDAVGYDATSGLRFKGDPGGYTVDMNVQHDPFVVTDPSTGEGEWLGNWAPLFTLTQQSFTVIAGTYREVDPVSRIEGHLGVSLTVDGTTVTKAEVHGNLFRGFENLIVGREPNDPITYMQRICGV